MSGEKWPGSHVKLRQPPFRQVEEQMACHYECSFGIAQNVTQWPNNEQCFSVGHGTTFLLASGLQNGVYWFLFVRLPNVLYGKDIPRCTKDDEAKFVKERQGFAIKENLTFGQVYSRCLTSTLTPLHEIIFEKWSFKRMCSSETRHTRSLEGFCPDY